MRSPRQGAFFKRAILAEFLPASVAGAIGSGAYEKAGASLAASSEQRGKGAIIRIIAEGWASYPTRISGTNTIACRSSIHAGTNSKAPTGRPELFRARRRHPPKFFLRFEAAGLAPSVKANSGGGAASAAAASSVRALSPALRAASLAFAGSASLNLIIRSPHQSVSLSGSARPLREQNDKADGKAGHKPGLGFGRAKAGSDFLIYRKNFWTFVIFPRILLCDAYDIDGGSA